MQADAAEDIDRTVLAKQIPAAEPEKRPRRDVELIGRDAVVARHRLDAPFRTQPVVDRGRRRFLHGDDHVVSGFVAVAQLGDLHSAKEAERREPALRVVQRARTERIAALHLQLALDGVGFRVHVAGDHHVIDEHARSFANVEADVNVHVLLRELRTRLHVHVAVAEILIREPDGVAVDRELSRHVRRAGLQTDLAA